MFKPNQLVYVQEDGYKYVGEAMSYVTPEKTIMVRRVPGYPSTLEEQPLDKVEIVPPSVFGKKKLYVHYAQVNGRGQFPVDMLRYDRCAPLNFTLADDKAVLDDSYLFDKLIVATITSRAYHDWTYERWASFLWSARHIRTEDYVV